MDEPKICDQCHKRVGVLFKHYKFKNSQYEILQEEPINVLFICNNCIGHPIKWSEAQFCKSLGINPYNLTIEIMKRKSCCGN